MSVRRENTFRIDYANVPKKPSYDELHDFVATGLGLKFEEVLRLQPSRVHGCAFVKVNSLELAQKIVAEHDDKHETEVDGKTYKLRITLEDGAVEVKLTDLSEDVSNDKIAEFLSAYGEVLSVTDQVWDSKYRFAGRPTGARIARMIVKRNIESYITIDGESTNVTYAGQLLTCRHCSELAHSGISCVQNKKLLVQKTYANVAKQAGPKPVFSKPAASSQKTPFAKPSWPKPGEGGKPPSISLTQRPAATQPSLAAPKQSVPQTIDPKLLKGNPEQNALLMAPPLLISPISRMDTRQTSDGNETDVSSASGSKKHKSGRPAGKKQKKTHNNDANEEMDDDI